MKTRQAAPADLPRLNEMYRVLVRQMAGQGHAIWDEVYPCVCLPGDIQAGRLFVLEDGGAPKAAFCPLPGRCRSRSHGLAGPGGPGAVSGPPWRSPRLPAHRGGQPGASGGHGAGLRAGRAVSAPFCCGKQCPCPCILSKEWLFQSKRLPRRGCGNRRAARAWL